MAYIPKQRDIVYIDLDPRKGTEIAKRRPCLVISKQAINKKTNRILVCPITNTVAFSSTHVALPEAQKKVAGTIVVDQIRTLDFRLRNVQKMDTLQDLDVYDQIVDIINLMITR